MALFKESDIDNILNGSMRVGLGTTRAVNNAVRKSFRNKQLLRSTQQFNTEDLVDQLKQVANDALRLEKTLGLLRKNDPKNKDIKDMRNLLDALNGEKEALSRRLNEALASRGAANDIVQDISRNKTPLRRGSNVNQPNNRRTTLGSASLNVLGAAISVAGYVNNKRRTGRQTGNTSDLSSGFDQNATRQSLKISRDTYARDTEFQEKFKKDYDNTSDKIIRRLDKMIEKLDKIKGSGGGGSGSPPSNIPDIDIDLPGGEKKPRGNRSNRPNSSNKSSRFGGLKGILGGLVKGGLLYEGVDLAQQAGIIKDTYNGPDGVKSAYDKDGIAGAIANALEPNLYKYLYTDKAKPNTSTTTPSNPAPIPIPAEPAVTARPPEVIVKAEPPATAVIPPNQNFGGMPGLPRLNTARPLSNTPLSVMGGSEAAPAIKTNETDIDVRPQATVIINTRDLEIKGLSGGIPAATVGSEAAILNSVGGSGVIGGGIGAGAAGGGVYSGSGAGVGAIMGSRSGGRGQAFTPKGMQRETITSNAFSNQPTMTLPSDAAGQGTAGGGIDNPYGFAGMGTGGISAGNMGSASQLPGNVTSQGITSAGSYPKFLGTTSGGALGGLISSGEGGYGSYNKGIAGDSRDKIDFSQMTVGDLMQRQSLPRGDPNRIFAFGKYQVIPETMRGAVKAMGIDPNAKVTPQLQEEIYRNYLISQKRPEVKDYITSQNEDAGKLHNAQQGLAKEFASVADPDTGLSRYGGVGGNRASIGADKTSAALQEERRRYQENIKKGMKPEEAWSALSNPQGMDSSQSGPMAGGTPNMPEPRQGETPGQLASRIKSLNPNIGNGECVALAKQAVGLDATPGANSVSDWRKGESATARELPIGTPVATFMDRQGNDSNLYDAGQGMGISRKNNGGLGTTHAAVVAGYEKDGNGKITGMQVWEQWNGSGGPRLKTYPVDPNKPGADNAGNYYAVNDSKGNPLGGANNPLSREAQPTATTNSGPVYDPTKTFGDPLKFNSPAPPNTADSAVQNTPPPSVNAQSTTGMAETAGPMSVDQMNNLSPWRNEKNKPTSWYQDPSTGNWKPMFNGAPNPGTGTAAGAGFSPSAEGFKPQALGNRGFSGVNPTGAGAFTLPDGTVINSTINRPSATQASLTETPPNASMISNNVERNLDGTYGANHSPTPEGATGNVDTSSIADAGVFGQNVDKAKQDYLKEGQLRPGESFQDWIKRREDLGFNDNLGGTREGEGKGSNFKSDEFSMSDMNYKLQQTYKKSQIPGTTESWIQNDIEQGVSRDEARRNRQRAIPDEFTPAAPMGLDEIRQYGSSNAVTAAGGSMSNNASSNASTNSSDVGATRQSAAPPPPETPAPSPIDNSGGSNNAGGSSNNRQANPVEDQKAVGESTGPSIDSIPVKHDDLGLAALNTYDL